MNVLSATELIEDLAAVFAEVGIAVVDSRQVSSLGGGCCAMASFPLGAAEPDGVLVQWVGASSTGGGRRGGHHLDVTAMHILNGALAALLAEMGYSIRSLAASGGTLVTPTPSPVEGHNQGGGHR